MKIRRNAHTSDILILTVKDLLILLIIGILRSKESLIVKRVLLFDITYSWQVTKRDGCIGEGGSSLARRAFGRVFLGETYKKIR